MSILIFPLSTATLCNVLMKHYFSGNKFYRHNISDKSIVTLHNFSMHLYSIVHPRLFGSIFQPMRLTLHSINKQHLSKATYPRTFHNSKTSFLIIPALSTSNGFVIREICLDTSCGIKHLIYIDTYSARRRDTNSFGFIPARKVGVWTICSISACDGDGPLEFSCSGI
jgi:hypothetical protein